MAIKLNFEGIPGADLLSKTFAAARENGVSMYDLPEGATIRIIAAGDTPDFYPNASEDNEFVKLEILVPNKAPQIMFRAASAFWNTSILLDENDIPTWNTERKGKVVNLKTYCTQKLDGDGDLLGKDFVLVMKGWHMIDVTDQMAKPEAGKKYAQLNQSYYQGARAYSKARTKWGEQANPSFDELNSLNETLVNSGLVEKVVDTVAKLNFEEKDFVKSEENRKHVNTVPLCTFLLEKK